jgi:hypothetical protein
MIDNDDRATFRYYMWILRRINKPTELWKKGIPSTVVASRMLAAMQAGSSKSDVIYTYLIK